jgi:thiol-disulfide isomerase/thioredoxin
MANPPAKKKTTSNTAKAKSAPSGRPAGLFTLAAVGLVLLVVIVLVAVKVTSGNSNTKKPNGTFQPTSATIVKELTSIPASVFNKVGIDSPVVQIYAPNKISKQPALQWADSSGVKRPTVFYLGAEYCPYCAATRWATIIALSRFGTISGLGNMFSSSLDVYKNTPTFTFIKAKYVSKYINFVSVESFTNIPQGTFYKPLQTPTAAENALVNKYDNAPFVPASSKGSIPFIDFGNVAILSGSAYSPSALANTTRDAIAGVLSDPTNALTQAIIASANLQTASICKMINNADAAVCTSKGVKAASTALGF